MKRYIFVILVISMSLLGLTSCGEQKTNLTQDFPLEKFEKININNDSWDLIFKSSKDDEMHVEVNGEGDKTENPVDISLENGIIHITQNDSSSSFISGFTAGNQNKITVYLPKDLNSPINIQDESGDITMENVSFSDLTLTTSSGAQEITNVKLDNAIIESESGDTTIKNSSIKKMNTKSKSGCVYFTDVSNNEIYVSTDSGEVVFKEFAQHQTSDITTDSGDISVLYKIKPTSLKFSATSYSSDISVSLDNLKLELNTEEERNGTIGSGNNSLKISSHSGIINIR